METFVQSLKSSNFSPREIEEIIKVSTTVKYKKGSVFSHAGKNWSKLGMLSNGILGGWRIDKNADKRMSHFYYMPYNYLVVDYASYIKDKPAELTIEVLDDCTILEFSREEIEQMKQKFPQLLVTHKILAEEKYLEAQKLLDMFQNSNAVESIRLVQKHAPDILAKVPYSYIASFLGLHRNTFAEALKRV